MKTKATMLAIMALLFCVPAKSADLYVNNSGQSGTYTSIQTALNVASSGDRIFVSPYGVYTENLTISKSITIAPSIAGSNIVLNGKITFWPFASDIINIIGISALNCDLTTNTISATVNTKATINITGCTFSDDIILNNNAILVNTYYSECRYLRITYGNSIGNKVSGITYYDGPNTVLGDTNLIVSNLVNGVINYSNDDYYYRISNNRCHNITINKAVFNSNIQNYITNNWINRAGGRYTSTLYDGIRLNIGSSSDNYSNLIITGNVVHMFNNTSTRDYYGQAIGIGKNYLVSSFAFTSSNSPIIFYNLLLGSTYSRSLTLNFVDFGSGISGSLNENYNSNDIASGDMNGYLDFSSSAVIFRNLNPSDKSKVSELEFFVDLNAPTTEYYDLDLTRGDLGPWGGPYSWDNYWNTSNGNARIIDINLPSEIWPGQTVNLKAEAVHTN